MKCTLNPNIQNLSGKSGNVLFKTYTKRDGSKETRAYLLPKQKDGSYGYERRTPVSEAERRQRLLFKWASEYYARLTETQLANYRALFQRNNRTFNGKKYATLRGYVIARYLDSNKQS